MNHRIQQLSKGVEIVRGGRVPVSITKARLVTESLRSTEGQPPLIRAATAIHHLVGNASLHIGDGELIVGNPATKPWGVEITPFWGTWPDEEVESLEQDGYILDPDVREFLPELNDYWSGRCLTARMTGLYDEERLWPYAQSGMVLPAFRNKEEGWGSGGLLGGGYGLHHEISQMIGTPDYGMALERGLDALRDDARSELAETRLISSDAVRKADFLRATILALEAVVLLAERFAALAEREAVRQESPRRRAELEAIAQTCRHVPRYPARTFREAIQSYWFLFLCMCPSGTLGMGRLDQLLHPWYEADVGSGLLDDTDVLELLSCIRLRTMEITIQGGRAHRSKWAGGSKWHNATIGGQLADGGDATNRLSYLLLDAALECPTPHHTLTMRVHEGTPDTFLRRGIEVARSGLGMPAFVSDEANYAYLETQGIGFDRAWDYSLAGSLSISLTGDSRLVASPMFVVPRVLMLAMHGGVDPRTGLTPGPTGPPLEGHDSFDSFLSWFHDYLDYAVERHAEFNNVTIYCIGERFPRPVESAFMRDAFVHGRDVFERTFTYDNSNFVNPIGVVNVANSLAVIRDLVFEAGTVSAIRLREALVDDWRHHADLREECLAVPKFGNGLDSVDALVALVYDWIASAAPRVTTVTGGTVKPSSLTIGTSAWPGGLVTGATPDGRVSSDPLAEESLTPMRGSELGTPWDVVASAAKVDQVPYQAMELDLRLAQGALDSDEAIQNLVGLIRGYFSAGGKHLQFSVVDEEALEAAIIDPEAHPDLTVRLGGTSAYFAQLSPDLRHEIVKRSVFRDIPASPSLAVRQKA